MKHTTLKKIFITLLLSSLSYIEALVIGSDLLVSLQPLASFPLTDLDNTMEGFAWFKSGFTIGASTSSAVFNSVFPVSGAVTMNGGTLNLSQDLNFTDVTTLNSLGTINGNGHYISFPTSVTSFPPGNNIFQNCVVYINNDISLTSTMTFGGTCILNGNGHTINLNSGGAIVVANGGSLTITNAALKNISGSSVQCLNNAGVITLDNLTWVQNNNFTFAKGAINVSNEVDFKGSDIFAYQSTMTCSILSNATCTFDLGFTFSYDTNSPNLLQFADNSSVLVLKSNAALHATINGLNLTKGTLFAIDSCFIGSEIWTVAGNMVDNGITFGDCHNVANDMVFNVDAGVTITVSSGSLNYKNVNFNSLNMGDNLSSFFIQTNASLNSYLPMNVGNTVTTFANNGTLGQAPHGPYLGSVATQGIFSSITLPDC